MTTFLQLLLSGIMVGGVYALVAMAFVLIYKSSRILNFSQGALVMIGAYILWAVLVDFGLSVWLALLVSLAGAAILGLAMDRFALRPLIGQPLLVGIMMTIALSYVLVGVTTGIWGVGGAKVYPEFIPAGGIYLGGVMVGQHQLICFAIAMALFVSFVLFFQRTRTGLNMRITAESHEVAQSMGIEVKRIFAIAWAISALISGVAGILLASIFGLSPNIAMIGLRALPVVLLGGLESFPGAIVAGLLVGIGEKLAEGYIGAGFGEVFPFILMIVVLLIRPYGLFGLKTIERI